MPVGRGVDAASDQVPRQVIPAAKAHAVRHSSLPGARRIATRRRKALAFRTPSWIATQAGACAR